jgi:predicted permease
MLIGLYRAILRLCPAHVREEYAAEMEAAFRQSLEIERARRGPFGRLFAYGRGFADALVFAVSSRFVERLDRRAAVLTDPERRELEAALPQQRRRPIVANQDARATVRLMRKQPIFTAAVLVMLALGIGATTAIFSVVYGVLLKPLPFPNPERIVQIYGAVPSRNIPQTSLTEANFWDLRDLNRTFDELGAMHSASFTLTGFDQPERVNGAIVSVGFFRGLGVRPAAGRLFEPGEDDPGAPRTRALLSYGFWTRRFNGDRGIVGRPIQLDGRAYDVVGVLPSGTTWVDAADVFVPFIRRPNANRGSWEYLGIGRLKPGVTIEAGLDDLKRVSRDLEARYPENKGLTAAVRPSSIWIGSDQLRQTLWILLGAVMLLLVIACVNVTNLLLARASTRVRESAVRTALGATRADLIRERLTESLILSAVGAVLGWLVAVGLVRILQSLDPGGIPRLAEVQLNGWVLAFTAGATLIVGIFTGLVPALQAPSAHIVTALRHGQRGSVGDRAHDRVRQVFVGAEVALSLVLLVGAGLLVRSLTQVLAADRGFETDHRLLATVSIPSAYPEDRRAQIVTDLLSRLQGLPDILHIAAVSARPLSPGSTGMGIVSADGPAIAEADVPWASWRIVTKDYFAAMGLTLTSGRGFNEQDLLGKPWRVIISKRLATTLWKGEDPIGRTAILWKGQSQLNGEVIGVVSDMRERGLESDPTLAVYIPAYGQMGATGVQLVMHTKSEPDAAAPAVRSIVAGIDPNLPVSGVRTLEETVTRSVATRRFTMLLLLTFAALAALLALAGVYGVLAYSIARRTSEIGVRLALGAQRANLLRRVIAQGMRPVFAGAVIGLVAMYWLSRLMTSLLFGVEPSDPITYAAVILSLMAAAVFACYFPARAVLRVDPVVALRVE